MQLLICSLVTCVQKQNLYCYKHFGCIRYVQLQYWESSYLLFQDKKNSHYEWFIILPLYSSYPKTMLHMFDTFKVRKYHHIYISRISYLRLYGLFTSKYYKHLAELGSLVLNSNYIHSYKLLITFRQCNTYVYV